VEEKIIRREAQGQKDRKHKIIQFYSTRYELTSPTQPKWVCNTKDGDKNSQYPAKDGVYKKNGKHPLKPRSVSTKWNETGEKNSAL
jgi:hypothetical protein